MANSNVVVPLGISYLLQRVLRLGCHVALVKVELSESFEVLLLFAFPFSVGAHLLPKRNVRLLQETSSSACHFVFRKVTYGP